MCQKVAWYQEANVVAGNHRYAADASDLECKLIEWFFAIASSACELQVQAVTEYALPVRQLLFGQISATFGEQLSDQAVTSD